MGHSSYDVVIIGSGMGALVCGNLLSKHGRNVLILERHSRPGGYVTSYRRNGFLFDVVHIIGGLKKGAPVDKVFSHIGVDKKIGFIEVDKVFRFIYPDKTVEVPTDIEHYREELIRHYPGETRGISRFLRAQTKIWSEILDSDYAPGVLKLMTYPIRFPNLVWHQNRTYEEFISRFFAAGRMREVIGSGWGYLGLNNSRISALYMVGMQMSYHHGGAWYPQGGYQCLSDALAGCFTGHGGTMRLNSGVKKIIVEDRRAIGVELDDGEQIRAQSVISNADTKKTFLNLIDREHIPEVFLEKVQRLQQSVSGFVVHLGVNMHLPENLHCGCNMFYPYYGIAENNFKLAEKEEMETDPSRIGFGLSVSTLKDRSLAPAGCHALDLIMMPAPYGYRNRWMNHNTHAYTELKETMAEKLIAAAEQHIQGLSSHIVAKDISTPLTYERYTGADNGCWYDMACTPSQSLLNRRLMNQPIDGLYLTGAKNFPGPGMFGAVQSGLFTADALLGNMLTRGKYIIKP
ncbi:MAG: phytoene desaturase family protein [Dissulfurispiraceae bacterium]